MILYIIVVLSVIGIGAWIIGNELGLIKSTAQLNEESRERHNSSSNGDRE